VDVVLFVVLGAAGFLAVVLVCAGVLAMLQLILPSTDAGAAAIDGPGDGEAEDQSPAAPALDAEGDA
jgi:hypothetical protein